MIITVIELMTSLNITGPRKAPCKTPQISSTGIVLEIWWEENRLIFSSYFKTPTVRCLDRILSYISKVKSKYSGCFREIKLLDIQSLNIND